MSRRASILRYFERVPERGDGQSSGARPSVTFFPRFSVTWPPTHDRRAYRKEERAPIGVQMCPPVVDNGQRRRRTVGCSSDTVYPVIRPTMERSRRKQRGKK